MTTIEELDNWRDVNNFHFDIELEIQNLFKSKKITRRKRDELIKKNSDDWDKDFTDNNPFLNNNPKLKKIWKELQSTEVKQDE